MHSFTTSSGNVYHHSGDFSGNVICESDRVPFADMLELVGEYYRATMIANIENLTPRQILEKLVK